MEVDNFPVLLAFPLTFCVDKIWHIKVAKRSSPCAVCSSKHSRHHRHHRLVVKVHSPIAIKENGTNEGAHHPDHEAQVWRPC